MNDLDKKVLYKGGVFAMKKYLLVVLVLLMSACRLFYPFYPPYDRYVFIQPGVFNLEGINTPYDEFNAAPPPSYHGNFELLYSSNASSLGDYFDIMHTKVDINMQWNGVDNYTHKHTFHLSTSEVTPFLTTNSPYDEYGPSLLPLNEENYIYLPSPHTLPGNLVYLFASNRPHKGLTTSNIYYYTRDEGLQFFAGNSTSNDFYPSYHRESKTLYFSSDRDGNFNIYSYHHHLLDDPLDLLKEELDPVLVHELNSPYDDKFPFIHEDIMVFASQRRGPYDLYFSRYIDGRWTSPKPLPSKIDPKNDDPFHYVNTDYNEYRPVLFKGWADRTDENRIMIFSSDRIGGAGGVDLYLAVLPLNTFDWKRSLPS